MASRHKKTNKKTAKPAKKTQKRFARGKSRQGARRKIDPQTGKELSRYAFEKKYGRKQKLYKRSSPLKFQHKVKLYKLILDDYIEKNRAELVTNKKLLNKDGSISKRKVSELAEMKGIIRDLHSKNPRRRYTALAKTGRISRDQIELYVRKMEGNPGDEGEGDE